MLGLNAVGENPLGTQETHYSLSINELQHSHTIEQTDLQVYIDFTINELQHNHTIEQTSITEVYQLTINELQHNHTIEQTDLQVYINFTINELQHGHTIDQTSITEIYQLTPNELQHSHTIEQTDLQIYIDFTIDELQHNHTLEGSFLIKPIEKTQNPPSEDRLKKSDFGLQSVVGVTESPFTLDEKRFISHGERWSGEFEINRLNHTEALEWKAWLAVLEGRGRSFKIGPPYSSPNGAVSQNGKVDSVTRPRQVTIKGLSSNTTNIFKRGDYIELTDTEQLVMVLKDVDSDKNGKVTVDIAPKLRKDPSTDTTVETQDPKGRFQLDKNDPGWQSQGHWTDIKYSFEEVVHDSS